MTVADVSAGNQYAVRPFQESFEQKAMIHPAGAHETDQADTGRILHAGYPGQIRPGISAPIAHECYDIWFCVR